MTEAEQWREDWMTTNAALADAQDRIVRLEREREIYAHECHRLQDQVERCTSILSRIYALLPPPYVTQDGVTYRFHFPDSLPADEILRALKERIEVIPDEIEKALQA